MKLKPEFIEMLHRLSALPGGEAIERLEDTLASTESTIGVRLNARKPMADSSKIRRLRPVTWCDNGFYIDGERPRFTLDPALHQGLYYVQDPSSMIISHVIKHLTANIDEPIVYIDACAAPGGKITAAIDALPEGSLVVANEFDRRRAEILRENIEKWGYENVVITRGDTSALARLRGFADIVAVDAPCSGEGMMRKEAVAVEQWSEALVEQCAALQREILDNCAAAVRPGGYLIYSTCTFNRREDEENLSYLIDTLHFTPVAIPYPADSGIAPGINTPWPAMRFIPGRVEGEGLFMAVVQKPGDEPREVKPAKVKEKPLGLKLPAALLNPTLYIYEEKNGNVSALPRRWFSEIEAVRRTTEVIYAGVPIGIIKGKDLLPTAALANSQALDLQSVSHTEVDYSTAISYLRGEALRLENAERGIVLLTYRGVPLGFVKNLGSRANNLYPDSRTIKTTHIPSEPVSVLC